MIRRMGLMLVIILIGLYLRGTNLSEYKFYPDTYQNLLVANNIKEYGGVVGYLGQKGMLFPHYFMWSRPIYPLMINLGEEMGMDAETAAELISFLAGTLGMVVAYFLGIQVYKSRTAGFLAMIIASISFNYVVWSGFVMADTVGILLALIYWAFIFRSLDDEVKWLSFSDLVSGLLLGLAVFSRYEYLVFLFLTVVLFMIMRINIKRLGGIFFGFGFMAAVILSLWFPVLSAVSLILTQTRDLVVGLVLGIIGFGLVLMAIRRIKIDEEKVSNLMALTCYLLAGWFLVLVWSKGEIPWFLGLSGFVKTDFLLAILGVAGVGMLLYDKKRRKLGQFLIVSILAMELVYFRINEEMIRYQLHLLPFLVLPAAFVLMRVREKFGQVIFLITLFGLFWLQIQLSAGGIGSWSGGDYRTQSYEEVAAKKVAGLVRDDELILAAMPEPYYFYTGNETRSITTEYPYVDFDGLDEEQKILVIDDMGMKDIFPEFSEFLERYQPIDRFKVGRAYHYQTRRVMENDEVKVYRLSMKILLQALYGFE